MTARFPTITLRTLVDAEQALRLVQDLPAGARIEADLWHRVFIARNALHAAIEPLVAVPVGIERPEAEMILPPFAFGCPV